MFQDRQLGKIDIVTFDQEDGSDTNLNPDLFEVDTALLPGGSSGFEARATVDEGVLKIVVFTSSGATIPSGGQPFVIGKICYTLLALDPPGLLPAPQILAQEKDLQVDPGSFTLISDDQGVKIGQVDKTDGAILAGIRGDANIDGSVDVRDVVILVKEILNETLPDDQDPAFRADLEIRNANGQDDGIDVTDAVAIVNRILGIGSQLDKAIASGPVDIFPGSLVTLSDGSAAIPVVLDGRGVAGLQATFTFDLSLMSVGTPVLADAADGLMLDSRIENGTLRLIALGLNGQTLSAGQAVLIPVTLTGAGQVSLTMTDLIVSSAFAQTIPVQLGTIVQPVSGKGTSVPVSFSLSAAAPNPFNPATTISYEVPQSAHIQLTVYNLLGKEVIRLVDQVQQPGRYQITWNAHNARGASVASGVYLYRLQVGDGNQVETRKLVLVR